MRTRSLKGFRVATLDEIVEFGRPGLERRKLLPPIAGASGFAVDQQLGTNSIASVNVSTVTLTTTNAVAAGGLIQVAVGSFSGGAITSCTISGGGLTWTTAEFEVSASDLAVLGWALAPAGLAGSTVLTATFAPTLHADGPSIGAMSFTGAVSSSPQDGVGVGAAQGAGTAWNAGSITPTLGSLVVAVGWGDGTATTQTPSGGFTQGFLLADATNGDNLVLNYQLSAAGGAITPGGTWGVSQTVSRGAVAAFLPSAPPVVSTPTVFPVFLPRRLGPKAVGPTFFAGLPTPALVPTVTPGGSFTAADTSTSSDVATRVLALPRTASDTSVSTDSAVAVWVGGGYSTFDTSNSSDIASRVLVVARTAADTSASSDSASRVETVARTSADISNSSDSASRKLVVARTASDTSASSDAASRVDALPRTASDTSSSSDTAVTGAGGGSRTSGDTSLSSDSASRVLRMSRTAADTSVSTDSATRLLRLTRTATDTSLSSDSASRGTMAHIRTAADFSFSNDSASIPGATGPAPPRICDPTLAKVIAYTSTATLKAYASTIAILAYSSTATVRAYTSSAAVKPYTSKATVASYTSKATVTAYTSTATVIPYSSTASPKQCSP